MKIFEADDQERLEFITIEDDKLFAIGHQIMYFLMKYFLICKMQLQGMTLHKNLGSAGSRTAQLTDSDHLFYVA